MNVIFADDLTGACDVAAATGREVWIPVNWNCIHHPADVLVLETETRNSVPEDAKSAVGRALDLLPHPIVYWKIDSLLRGNWADELAEAVRRGALDRFMIAPAFPEQHRITSGGIQYAHGVPVSEYLGFGCSSISQRLLAAGLAPDRFRVVDAVTGDDLREAAASLTPEETPVGSAGLARVLWKPRSVRPARVSGTVLVVVGTASDRGREQMEPLRALSGIRIVEPDTQPAMLRSVQKTLAEEWPAALLVVGGDTLSSIARFLAFDGLLIKGEVEPGIALAVIAGGPMDSRQIVTKAGDFGDRDTLANIVRQML